MTARVRLSRQQSRRKDRRLRSHQEAGRPRIVLAHGPAPLTHRLGVTRARGQTRVCGADKDVHCDEAPQACSVLIYWNDLDSRGGCVPTSEWLGVGLSFDVDAR